MQRDRTSPGRLKPAPDVFGLNARAERHACDESALAGIEAAMTNAAAFVALGATPARGLDLRHHVQELVREGLPVRFDRNRLTAVGDPVEQLAEQMSFAVGQDGGAVQRGTQGGCHSCWGQIGR